LATFDGIDACKKNNPMNGYDLILQGIHYIFVADLGVWGHCWIVPGDAEIPPGHFRKSIQQFSHANPILMIAPSMCDKDIVTFQFLHSYVPY
jgi:hypothetical protein